MTVRDTWLEWRRGGIGASDVATIVGLSEWGGRWELWAEKTGRIEPESNIGVDLEEWYWFGHAAEEMIARRFTLKTGLKVCGEQTWAQHPDYPHHRSTLDGYVYGLSPDGGAANVLEIKTDANRSPWTDLPDKYAVQVQWQLHVAELDHAWVAALFAGQKLAIYDVKRDDQAIGLLVAAVDQFWTEHVLGDVAPIPDARDLGAIKSMWPASTVGLEHELDDDDVALLRAHDAAKAAERAAKKQKETIEAQLLDRVADAEILTRAGRTVATWKTQGRTQIDAKALRADHPDIVDLYGKTSTFRVLRPKPKELNPK